MNWNVDSNLTAPLPFWAIEYILSKMKNISQNWKRWNLAKSFIFNFIILFSSFQQICTQRMLYCMLAKKVGCQRTTASMKTMKNVSTYRSLNMCIYIVGNPNTIFSSRDWLNKNHWYEIGLLMMSFLSIPCIFHLQSIYYSLELIVSLRNIKRQFQI